MKKKMMIVALAAVLAGCGGVAEEPSAVPETVTETQTQTQTRTSTPAPTPSANALLEASWDMQTQEDQDSMCWGWAYDEEFVLDAFFSSLDETVNITRADAREFFERKCG